MTSDIVHTLIFAHAGHGSAGGFIHGLQHPISGLDHILAMLAVGVWAAMLGRRAVWAIPTTFVLAMGLGGAIGMTGYAFPAIEPGIAVSVMMLGLLIAAVAKVPIWVAAVLVSAFAIFHGVAHGSEMPFATSGVAYGAGFLISASLLMLCGVGIGSLMNRLSLQVVFRSVGAAVCIAGGFLVAGLL